jgi:hypothetical protein
MSISRREVAAGLGALAAAAVAFRASEAEADCPNITKAITALTLAQGDLQTAKHDFDGHRAQALKDVNAALASLGLCLACKQCK